MYGWYYSQHWLKPSIPTTVLQNRPNFDHVMHDQECHNTPITEGTDSQPPTIMQELPAYKPALISSPELEISPFSISEIDRQITIVQKLVDRGRPASSKVSKCGSAVSMIEVILERTSLIREGIQEIIIDCEAGSKKKQEGCLQISSRISKQILGLVYALETQRYKTLLEVRKYQLCF